MQFTRITFLLITVTWGVGNLSHAEPRPLQVAIDADEFNLLKALLIDASAPDPMSNRIDRGCGIKLPETEPYSCAIECIEKGEAGS